MSRTIKVLFLAAEAEPFIKVGGLGDVAGSLPRALRALSNDELKLDIRLVLPHHPAVKAENLKSAGMFSLARGDSEILVEVSEAALDGMPVYFIGGDPVRTNGSVYSLNAALDAEKYVFFSFAAVEMSRHLRGDWQPDVVHANDWHTALSMYVLLGKHWQNGAPRPASVITVHNLPFMGPDSASIIQNYGMKLAQTDLPEWARVMPLPLGLWASDAIVAVSPAYGREILTPQYGCGLEDFLLSRGDTVSGILNGLDTDSFNPASDAALSSNFDINSIEKRAANKDFLQQRLGLPRAPETPLFAMVSRMDVQKGVDLAFSALKMIKNLQWQAVILGTGDPKLEAAAAQLQEAFPDRLKVETRYDAGLARQIYAGSDLFLMPSRYEPCGLSQMIAMRYGCVPLARAAGGLNDTVIHGVTGFVFEKAHHMALAAAIKSALKVFARREVWREIQRAGMTQDFSWKNSAQKYLELYQSLLQKA